MINAISKYYGLSNIYDILTITKLAYNNAYYIQYETTSSRNQTSLSPVDINMEGQIFDCCYNLTRLTQPY
ncbi:MAG: hypothetical protein M3247_04365 [Thermoproteota archaeon]|nr:hypothetical protein [Thermoproteota archaeon]